MAPSDGSTFKQALGIQQLGTARHIPCATASLWLLLEVWIQEAGGLEGVHGCMATGSGERTADTAGRRWVLDVTERGKWMRHMLEEEGSRGKSSSAMQCTLQQLHSRDG